MSKSYDENLSKSLSFLLRHRAEQEGLAMDERGFVTIEDLLKIPKYSKYSQDDILNIVNKNDKQRYSTEMDETSKKLKIRANQGHSIPGIIPDLKVISGAELYPKVIHGTFREVFESIIRFEGLNRMARNHIHFAIGEPEDDGVISGMSNAAEIYIFIDLQRAIDEGFKFYESLNKVILCPGDDQGFLPPKYFRQIWDAENEQFLDPNFEKASSKIDVKEIQFLLHPTTHKQFSKIRKMGIAETKGRYINFVINRELSQEDKKKYDILVYVKVSSLDQDEFVQYIPEELLYKGRVGLADLEKAVEIKTQCDLPL